MVNIIEEAQRLGWSIPYLRQVRARRRFKGVVGLIIRNLGWIDFSEGKEPKIGDDMVTNIQMITNRKKNKMTIEDLAILNIPPERRTRKQRKHLRGLDAIKFFKKYPLKVQEQLMERAFFRFYGPDRVIIRQGHPPHNVYFLISGQVVVLKESFDDFANEKVQNVVALLEDGTAFGDVAVLHEITRTVTCVSKTNVELLCLRKDDFNEVLRDTIMVTWNHVSKSMDRFEYFENWNAMAKRECCMATKVKSFKSGETIFGDGVGFPAYAYFILKGTCRLIEHVYFEVTERKGKKHYRLYEPNMGFSTIDLMSKSELSVKSEDLSRMPSRFDPSSVSLRRGPSSDIQHQQEVDMAEIEPAKISSIVAGIGVAKAVYKKKSSENPDDVNMERLRNVEMRFMQVSIYTEMGCFNVGEKMKNRRVIAIDDVECMIVPRYWLLRHNLDGTWTRVHQFLDTYLPTTRDIFHEFLSQQVWKKYKEKLVEDIVKKQNRRQVNCIHNVPYSIRIKERYHASEGSKLSVTKLLEKYIRKNPTEMDITRNFHKKTSQKQFFKCTKAH